MLPKSYLQSFAANVVKRSGINLPTVMAVLPHVFDEIRFQLTEGTLCVPIESFGTFAVIAKPERQRRYTYKGVDEVRTYPPTMCLKFKPTHSFKQEIAAQQFNPTRQSFFRHRDDRPIRKRRHMRYNKRRDIYIEYEPGSATVNHVVDNFERIEKKPTKWKLRKMMREQNDGSPSTNQP